MLTEFQKRWVAALRSGKYKQQTDSCLHNDNGYCCLGVACDLLVEDGLLVREPHEHSTDGTMTYRTPDTDPERRSIALLGKDIRPFVGDFLDHPNGPSCGVLPDGKSLATLNDDGRSFEYIADVIEKTFS